MKRTLFILLICIFTLYLFTGCATNNVGPTDNKQNNPTESPVGKWYLDSINEGSVLEYLQSQAETYGMNTEELISLVGLTNETIDELMTIQLNEDGSAVITSAGDEPETGTWSLADTTITISYPDSDQTTSIIFANGKLITSGNSVNTETGETTDEQSFTFIRK